MFNELHAVLKQLGGQRMLGRRLTPDHDLREAIREGSRRQMIEELMRSSRLDLERTGGIA